VGVAGATSGQDSTTQAPLVPPVALPVEAPTTLGERVRLRRLADGEARPDAGSRWDDWGTFDLPPGADHEHGRAMVEVRLAEGTWQPVGDLSWHGELYGPNLASRAVSIGIALHAGARGRGIGPVAQALLAAALHRAGVHRVEASTDVENLAEQRALERAGFRREGVLRGAQVRADGRHDLVLYSCLPGEAGVQLQG
jgi:RimJ/RimL family protein N-acetyltransferase